MWKIGGWSRRFFFFSSVKCHRVDWFLCLVCLRRDTVAHWVSVCVSVYVCSSNQIDHPTQRHPALHPVSMVNLRPMNRHQLWPQATSESREITPHATPTIIGESRRCHTQPEINYPGKRRKKKACSFARVDVWYVTRDDVLWFHERLISCRFLCPVTFSCHAWAWVHLFLAFLCARGRKEGILLSLFQK